MAVDLAPDLLEILVCPNCHSTLAVDHDRSELVCTGPDCALAYPVRGQIPILLIDEARAPERAGRPAAEAEQSADPGDRPPATTDAATDAAPTDEASADEPAGDDHDGPARSPEA